MIRSFRLFLPFMALMPGLIGGEAKSPTALAFIRTQAMPEQVSGLQTLSQQYVPANGVGPIIWLIGVAHLGTKEYYSDLQKRLDSQTSVLFEGVGGGELTKGAKLNNDSGLQGQLARALGLVFQLDAIDYQRPNFHNSDLTPERLNQAIARRAAPKSGEKGGRPPESPDAAPTSTPRDPGSMPELDNQTYKMLMDALHGEGEMAEAMGNMTALIGSTPEMRETTKLMLLEALGQAGELLDLAKSMSPELKGLFEVLITERNAEVLTQLESQVKTLGAAESVAVFYGAAHMDELAKRLTEHLNYKPGTQLWNTAFTANGAKSFMQPAQIKMIMQMMRTQMQNPGAASPDTNAFPLLNLFGPSSSAPGAPGATPQPPPGKIPGAANTPKFKAPVLTR